MNVFWLDPSLAAFAIKLSTAAMCARSTKFSASSGCNGSKCLSVAARLGTLLMSSTPKDWKVSKRKLQTRLNTVESCQVTDWKTPHQCKALMCQEKDTMPPPACLVKL